MSHPLHEASHRVSDALSHGIEKLSVTQTAMVGGTGSAVSLAAAAAIDPAVLAGWMQVASLAIGALTGLASFVLVALKLVQQGREMRRR